MKNIKVKDIVNATGGRLLCGDENVEVLDVCIDSRDIKEGDLFIPILGNNTDGHRFIESALEVGAATLTSEHQGVVIAEKPYIRVSDTTQALQDIGAFIRDKFQIPFVGITGSVGKTTTKDMTSTVLDSCLNVYHTEKNLNSEFGVPITLSRITEDAEVAVIEMGISKPGEMDLLSRIVRPHICVVSTIGVAHMEYMKTRENICKEKLDIVKYMDEDGVLFLNGNDDMLAATRGKTKVTTFYYGTEDWCDYRAENICLEKDKSTYDYVHGNTRIPVVLNALGKNNVINSLVGMAIADYMGLDLEKGAKALETFEGSRLKRYVAPNDYIVLDDTYNASPDSMKSSIDVLCDLECTGKRVAVLGDMLELGESSEKFHYQVGEYLAGKGVDELIVVGELSENIKKAVEEKNSSIRCFSFKDNGEIALFLLSEMQAGDILLVKGSNGMHLKEIVDNIMGERPILQ